MTSQRGSESAHMNHKGPCHTALCSSSSSSHGSSLRPPKSCGGQSKPVQFSTVGSSWVAERQTGLLTLLLSLLWYMPMAGGLEVKTAEMPQMVFLHANVTIVCVIPGLSHLDITTVGIIWSLKNEWHEAEVPIYEFYGNHLKAFRPGASVSLLGLERGDASLHLPRIELSEAGEYRCKLVVTPDQAEGTTRLDVVAYPAMALFVKAERYGEGQHIICKLDGFYPEAFDIKWERCTLKDSRFRVITDGIVIGPTVKNDDGTFSVTSSLALKPALEDRGIIYHCVVSHRSLLVPRKLNLTLPEKGSVEIYVTIVFPSVLLGLVLVFWLCWCCYAGAATT
ncbi:natural cytotoxicity triggering receptor 3 ligand 1 isoform X1 [Arvicola amphibius]|uniref:natural cytotoxicity triggering receptor 3 ligand 1 isoform X1 n=1 Tax=Arvicola amphibius TaxID=1047088 RepID=UPI0018E37609|nr:natural cytotoxicity triggering receptor 3 ligand 1 isoform X1 [Arvicola amphibius]